MVEIQQNQPTPNLNVAPQTQQPPMPKASPFDKIRQTLDKVKSLPILQNLGSKFNAFNPQQKRLLKIGGGILAITFLLLILVSIVKSFRSTKPVSTPTPVPASQTPLPTPAGIGKPSIYATDSGVLKIENDINVLRTKLDGTDLEESNLKPPDINFYVNFTQ